jgi:hypothetical protein
MEISNKLLELTMKLIRVKITTLGIMLLFSSLFSTTVFSCSSMYQLTNAKNKIEGYSSLIALYKDILNGIPRLRPKDNEWLDAELAANDERRWAAYETIEFAQRGVIYSFTNFVSNLEKAQLQRRMRETLSPDDATYKVLALTEVWYLTHLSATHLGNVRSNLEKLNNSGFVEMKFSTPRERCAISAYQFSELARDLTQELLNGN